MLKLNILLSIGLALLGAWPARADVGASPPLPFNLSYAGDQGCPTQAAFERELLQRLTLGATTSSVANARLTVTLRRRSEASEGSVLLESAHSSFSRSVSAKQCHDLAKALALIVAVAWAAEPRGAASDESAMSPESAPATPAPTTTSTAGAATATRPLVAKKRSTPAASGKVPGESDSGWVFPDLRRPIDRTHWAVLAAGEMRSGLGRNLVPYPRLGVELRYQPLTALSPVVGLSLAAAQNDLQADNGPDAATLYWFDGRAHGCLPSLLWAGRLALRTCWTVGAGLVRIVGTKSKHAAATTRGNFFWSDVAAFVRVEGSLSRHLELSTYGGASVPFSRLTLATAGPSGEANVWYRAPQLGFVGGLALGWVDAP